MRSGRDIGCVHRPSGDLAASGKNRIAKCPSKLVTDPRYGPFNAMSRVIAHELGVTMGTVPPMAPRRRAGWRAAYAPSAPCRWIVLTDAVRAPA